MVIPDWALRFREKGTQITEINGRYYLYRVKSKWNPEKHRAQKITEGYVGRVTPDGIRRPDEVEIAVREFGATDFIMKRCSYIIDALKLYSGWESMLIFAMFRLMHASPLKRVKFYYDTSYISEIIDADVSPKALSSLLRDIGLRRETTQAFLKHFLKGQEAGIIDLTHVFSMSENIISAVPGYDRNNEYLPGIRLILLFDLGRMRPGYYRFVAGSISDVSTIKITLKESGIKRALLIGDKGFYSDANITDLESSSINYIIPLRRNSSFIDYEPCMGDSSKFSGYFMFEGRPIWYSSRGTGRRRVIMYLDESLRLEEEKDTLIRDDGRKIFQEKQFTLGTIAVMTDLDKSEREVYELLKQRANVEQAFDVLKNTLNADRTYMRDDYSLEGWFLINFVALLFYYEIYNLLRDKNLLSRYSPMDVLVHLSRIHRLRVKNRWVTSEIPRKSGLIAEKLGLHIT